MLHSMHSQKKKKWKANFKSIGRVSNMTLSIKEPEFNSRVVHLKDSLTPYKFNVCSAALSKISFIVGSWRYIGASIEVKYSNEDGLAAKRKLTYFSLLLNSTKFM